MNSLAQYMGLIVEPTYEEFSKGIPGLFGTPIWLAWFYIMPLTGRRIQMTHTIWRSNE
jgi:hypothetical protein